jgi:hypothetical protein
MSREALDNVFDQVGYCGIWCGSCAVGTGALMALAVKYRDMADSHGLGHWGAEGFDYAAFLKALGAIAALPACAGCLKGGGRDDCELRSCASARGLRGCVACPERQDCRHGELLAHMRTGAHRAGLVVVERPAEHDLTDDRRRRELEPLWWWRALFGGGTGEERPGG